MTAKHLLLGTLALFLGALALGAAEPQGDMLVYGAGLVPRGLNPLLDRNEWNEVSSVLLSRLVRPGHDGRIAGDLAESWTASDDGLTWRFRLRPGLRWHDGAPLTAADVAFTWRKLFDPATATTLDLNQPMVARVEAAGAREVVFHLKYADAGLLAPLTEIAILPEHILREADLNAGDFDRSPVGSGPYKLVSHRGTEEYVLERHEQHHFGVPPIRRLVLRVLPGDEARAAAVARGEVHLAQVKPQQVEALRANKSLRVYRMRTGAWRALPLNLRRVSLQDARVRRAIDLAIDRDAIVREALLGFGQPAWSPIPPVSWAYSPVMNEPRYDPKQAARLLDAAGWKKNAEGRRERKGEILTLPLIVWQDEIFRRTAAEMIEKQLGALGVRVVLHRVDGATYNRLAQEKSPDYAGFIGGWGGLLDPGDNLAKKFHSGGSQNYGGYSNPEVDTLLERARALGPDRREEARRLYRQAVDRVTADAVFLPLAYPDYVFAADARLEGLDDFVCDSWYEFTKFAHEWRWPEE